LVSLVLLALALPVSAQNIVSIGDHIVDPGEEIRVPIYLNDSTNVAGTTIRLDYDPAVVMAYSKECYEVPNPEEPDTNITICEDRGSFTDYYAPDNSHNTSGYIRITTMRYGTPMSGNKKIGYVRLQAVGSPCSSSELNLTFEALTDDTGIDVSPKSDVDGSFTIKGPCGPKILDVNISVTGVGEVGHSIKDIAKVKYTNFSSGDDYNISVYYPNKTLAKNMSGTLTGANPEIIPVNYTPPVTGNYTVNASGRSIVDSKSVDAYPSGIVPVVPELATVVLVSAGILGLIGMRRYKKE
jgi:hypothetical protein